MTFRLCVISFIDINRLLFRRTTKVYVSGLPEDITEEAFIEFMSKCGVIDVDVRTNKPKAKP